MQHSPSVQQSPHTLVLAVAPAASVASVAFGLFSSSRASGNHIPSLQYSSAPQYQPVHQ